MEPIFLKPYFRSKIWGSRKFEKIFNDLPEGKIGEAWIISGYPNCSSTVIKGSYQGLNLRELYQQKPDLFGQPHAAEFPLLVKLLDANDNLSVQVHPDDEYAKIHENDSGKTECWYILQAEPGAKLIYGHHAETKEQLAAWIKNGQWNKLLRYVPIKTGDFLYVPAGCVHALTKGIMVIETQQSSDVTYRLYDWDRIDNKTGQKRELHIQQSLDTIQLPHVDPYLERAVSKFPTATLVRLANPPYSPHFYLWQLDVFGEFEWNMLNYQYLLVSVISGQGKLIFDGNDYNLSLGDSFIVPNKYNTFKFVGESLKIIISAPTNEEQDE